MTVSEILDGIRRLRVLVVGDICLDRWCAYDPRHAEPSRETNLPRIGVVSVEVTPGGGGTVANNAVALGAAQVAVLGAAGDDGHGFELRRALRERGIDSTHLLLDRAIPTFTYTKLINRATSLEDLPRVDFLNENPLGASLEELLLSGLNALAPQFDVIVALDQSETEGAGVVTPRMRALLTAIARRSPGTVVWADSRIRCETFRGVTLKVNRQEAEAACARIQGDLAALKQRTAAPRLFVTAGGSGVRLLDDSTEDFIPARRIENPVDICGAGDSFSAAASCALALGASAAEAAAFGNLAASVTITKPGTGTATPAEILAIQPGNGGCTVSRRPASGIY